MAKKDNVKSTVNKSIVTQLQIIKDRMANIYKDTYSADREKAENLEKITNDIENVVSSIIDRNTNDVSSISKLYSKLKLNQITSDKKYTDSVLGYFENTEFMSQLLSSYSNNIWIKEMDAEIDTVCKYMPKLLNALDAIKDAVLSADNFEKEFCSFNAEGVTPSDLSKFAKKASMIKNSYDAETKIEEWYNTTSRYGETLVYNVPYDKAIRVLMDRRKSTKFSGGTMYEGSSIKVLSESSYVSNANKYNELKKILGNLDSSTVNTNLVLEVSNGGLLESAITEVFTCNNLMPIVESKCVEEQSLLLESTSFDNTIPNDLEFPNDISSDGLVKRSKTKDDDDKIKSPGVLLKELDHSNTIFLYMNNVCLGYYYLEFFNNNSENVYQNTVFKRRSDIANNVRDNDIMNQNSTIDNMLKFVSSQIVDQLDSKFINANPDLTKEIYSILDYNDIASNSQISTVRVTFIPPQDVEHITFKQDPVTHRGISDLAKSLIPAKLWSCLYISYSVGILTRGQDKRVYYVKQNIEQNIAQTMMNVIEQIKKNNFNIMQIENMNSILNMTGQFNDYVIPVGMSGDSPINMEVMQGQEINPQTEFMDRLEENAITETNCPMDLLSARAGLEFASQLTMTNGNFMRFVYKRQTKYQSHLTNIFKKVYRIEYPDDTNTTIRCVLPSPVILNMSALSQLLEQVTAQATTLASIEYPAGVSPDAEKKQQLFIKTYIRSKLSGYIKIDEIEQMKDLVDLEFSKLPKDENM